MLAKVGLLFAAVYATAFALVWFVPEGNDYGRITVSKQERLRGLDSPKIVLVGGSNMAYGIDSPMIESATGCPVVNMGINGYFGVRYMLSEVRDAIRPGDIVVVAFEYDNYFKSVDGTARDHIVVIKNYPDAVRFFTPTQQLAILGEMPFVAHQKALRLMRTAVVSAKEALMGAEDEGALIDIRSIESFGAFNPQGDIVAHLGVTWPYQIEQGIFTDTVDADIVPEMAAFSAEMRAREADVMVSYSALQRSFYAQHQVMVDSLHDRVTAAAEITAPSRPTNYVFDDTMFFDTVYHLNAEGRALRTQRLIADIESQFGAHERCGGAQTAQTGD